MRQTGTMAYLVGRVITATDDGQPLRSVHDGRPVCLVDQGETFVELHPGAADDLRALAGGLRLAEFRAQLGDADADELLGYLLGAGLVVVDPTLHLAELDRLRLAADLTDTGSAEGTDHLRTVRAGSGATVVLTRTTVAVVQRNLTGSLGAAVRALVAEGHEEEAVRGFLLADLRLLLTRAGGTLYRAA